ncbi:MAG: class I SAM-dependent methyltransferase [Acidobacteria bacterium]|nr:class I SAM-dependent methyltransferase [Acidobacteriota bacterium]
MSGPEQNNDGALIVDRLQEIRERIAMRLSRPELQHPAVSTPSLDDLRDTHAQAANLADLVGKLNPRPPGVFNELIQAGKRTLARALDWALRPQRDFNREVVAFLSRVTEALAETNRNVLVLAEALQNAGVVHKALGEEMDAALNRICERYDAQLSGVREQIKLQKWALEGAMTRQGDALQNRTFELLAELQDTMWKAIEAASGNLREEIRVLRQRVAAQARVAAPESPAQAIALTSATATPAGIDYFQIERHFRGTEEEIRERQKFYVPYFQGRRNVLDIACGRGEFLELMRHAGVNARGVDLDADMVGRCLEKSLTVTQADVFDFLKNVPDASLDGIFCAQFVEHLNAEGYIRLLTACGEKLAAGSVLAVETQNPECLAIFSQSFYLDPTHVKPIPPALLRVLLTEAGFDRITTHYLSLASAGLPVLPELSSPAVNGEAIDRWNAEIRRFNETFFGGMDYALIGYRAAKRRS